MWTYPLLDPVAFSLGPLHVHWYGLMYLLGFTLAWGLALWRVKHYHLHWTSQEVSDLIFYAALGVILGGRCGYMLFYNTHEWFSHPLSFFKIWEGGMSFHGGLLGVLVALLFFARQTKRSFFEVSDFIAPLVPLGLAAGRIGNFINGELWGRITDVPWAMIFPNTDGETRHPSQLYEFGLEGLFLFLLVWIYATKSRPKGRVSAVFMIGYASCRMLAECFREPDKQLGFLAFNWLTMGQLLCLPMLAIGLWLWWSKR